jgi:hypothetical protein
LFGVEAVAVAFTDEEDDIDYSSMDNPASTFETPIGKLMFPDYSVHNFVP